MEAEIKEFPIKDVLVVGFGAVGAIYSLILKRSGLARVTAVARSNYESVAKNGMHYQSKKYGNISGWRPDRLCRSVEEASGSAYSYVFVTTKALPEMSPTSNLLQPFLSAKYLYPQPTYVLVQNGLGVEKDLHKALLENKKDNARIISSTLWIGTNLLSENVVEHADFDRLSIGIYRPDQQLNKTYQPGDLEILEELSNILASGGSTMKIVPDIQREKYRKNIWNLGYSTYTSLTRYPLPIIYHTLNTQLLTFVISQIRLVLYEYLSIIRALGYSESDFPSSLIEETIESTARIHSNPDVKHKASMLLDLELGKPMEVEVIVGEVVRAARAVGVDCPRIELIYSMLLVIQEQLKLKSKF